LPDGESGIFFEMGLDRANQIDPALQITLFAQSRKAGTGWVERSDTHHVID
jgi:hypothetical protein